MNKHIELVKKWLADKDSVSQQELIGNRNSAYAATANAADAAYAANAAANADAAYANAADADATNAAYWAATAAYCAATAYDTPDRAAYWVKQYEELTKTNKHILLVDLIKSILKVIGYTFMCLVFFALAINVAYVSAHETPVSRDMLLYEKCGVVSKEVVEITSYTRLRVLAVRDIADTTVFCILSGFEQKQHYTAPIQITVQYNWAKGGYIIETPASRDMLLSNDGL